MPSRSTFAVVPAAMVAVGLAMVLAAAPAARAAEAAADPVVARVDGTALHRSDIEAARLRLPPEAQKLPFEQVYPVLVDRLVNGLLIAEAGRKEHLDRTPEFRLELKRAEDRLVQEAYIRRAIAAADDEGKLKARYAVWVKAHPGQEEVHARHILVATEAEAKSLIAELDKGADFATLAKSHSTDPGAASGGDLGYFSRGEMVPEFAAAAFSIPVGQYSKTPVHTKFGWHIIKVEDKRMGKPPSFEEVRAELRDEAARDIVRGELKQLRGAAKVEIFGPDGKPLPPAK